MFRISRQVEWCYKGTKKNGTSTCKCTSRHFFEGQVHTAKNFCQVPFSFLGLSNILQGDGFSSKIKLHLQVLSGNGNGRLLIWNLLDHFQVFMLLTFFQNDAQVLQTNWPKHRRVLKKRHFYNLKKKKKMLNLWSRYVGSSKECLSKLPYCC